jgi:hypothetical protein
MVSARPSGSVHRRRTIHDRFAVARRTGEIDQGNIELAAADLHPDRERTVGIEGDRL